MQFLVMVQEPVSAEVTEALQEELQEQQGWISSFIPSNTFLVIAQPSHLPLLQNLPGKLPFRT